MARPRTGLTRDKILDAAVAFVDEHGPAALSARRLGAVLGVEGMTLYHYVANKDALLDGMVERILQEAVAGIAPGGPWPDYVRSVADGLRSALHRHPGMLTVVATRPAASPAALRILEDGLAVLRDQGVPLDLAMDVLNSAVMFTIGHALAEVGVTPGGDTAAVAAAPDAGEFPRLAEVMATGAGLDADRRYRRGLGLIVDGYALLAQYG